ncbi:MAG: hypothetical protein HY928_02940 [Elusimicrobia bacterium]|nr:hypothetical protein [Elusimicrobiota bacterium]
MDRLRVLTLAAAAALCALPVAAQVGAGASLAPDGGLFDASKGSTEAARTPLALALSLAFDATTWAAVGVSSPSVEVPELLARGYYRLEVLELVLMAKASGKRLLDLRTRRTKDGRTLRQLAEESGVSYDEVSDQAHVLAGAVERRVEDLKTVGPLPRTGGP